MARVASSATSVLIAHVAAHTSTIRLGAGGVMLPNHAPLTIAEQFGTLAELHPGRIDLGLGRAPGSDQVTMRALRRDVQAADTFPQDVLELQGYLSGRSRVPGVEAVPGRGTNVPLYVLGSSLFGAQLAAALGLPYAFASHFAPDALQAAVRIYRERFQPSEQLTEPYVLAGVNVIASDDDADALDQLQQVSRARVALLLGRGAEYTDDEADALLASPQGRHITQMMRYSAVGTPDAVAAYLDEFVHHADADELVVVHASPTLESRLHSIDLLADVWTPTSMPNRTARVRPPDAAAITRHADAEPDDELFVGGRPPVEPIVIVDADPAWPAAFVCLEQRIRGALGDAVLSLAHIGSTSVEGLAAKPIIDIDLTVADSSDEAAYVGALERAGFRLLIREPRWHEHRMLVSTDPRAHVHVWSPGSPEAIRHELFREWLRDHPHDRDRYAEAKRAAAAVTNDVGDDSMAYNLRKQAVIREILDDAFRAAGLL
jgi:luciferase family oxidoreductase group 1